MKMRLKGPLSATPMFLLTSGSLGVVLLLGRDQAHLHLFDNQKVGNENKARQFNLL